MYCYDYSKLDGLITEKFKTRLNFALALGLKDGSQITKYLSGNTKFTQTVITKWCNVLGIAQEKIGFYFFTLKVAE